MLICSFLSDKFPFIISKDKYSSTSVIFKSLRFLPVKWDIHFKLVWTTGPGKKEGSVKQKVNSQKEDICIKKSNDLGWLQANVDGMLILSSESTRKYPYKEGEKYF